MPQAPTLPPEMLQSAGASAPTSPVNFLLAAADAHSAGEFQSSPVPKGIDLQTGKASSRKKHLKVVK